MLDRNFENTIRVFIHINLIKHFYKHEANYSKFLKIYTNHFIKAKFDKIIIYKPKVVLMVDVATS